MVAKTIENLREKISEVVDQSKTLYIHQRNQNKKLLDVYRGKLSVTTVAMVTREILFFLETVFLPKKNFLCLHPRTPNFTPTDQTW